MFPRSSPWYFNISTTISRTRFFFSFFSFFFLPSRRLTSPFLRRRWTRKRAKESEESNGMVNSGKSEEKTNRENTMFERKRSREKNKIHRDINKQVVGEKGLKHSPREWNFRLNPNSNLFGSRIVEIENGIIRRKGKENFFSFFLIIDSL